MKIRNITIYIIFGLFILHLACANENDDMAKSQQRYFLSSLILPIVSCLPEGSIRPWSLVDYNNRSCTQPEIVKAGLIYNASTQAEIGSELKSSDKIELYCRSKEDVNAVKGGAWYKLGEPDGLPGQKIDLLYRHRDENNINYDVNLGAFRSKPFSNYESTESLFCILDLIKSQKLIVR